jgi:Fe-S cluster biogenesis protein NfuA
MSNVQTLLTDALADIKPMLAASGRAVAIKDVSDTRCVIELTGFCESCSCSESYKAGIEDLGRAYAPEMREIEFIQA